MCSRFLGQWHSAHIWSCGPYPVQWFHDSTNNGEGMCQRINLLKDMNIFVAVKSVKCLFDIILFFIIHLFISIYMQDYFKIFSISILFHTFILIIMIINSIDLCIFMYIYLCFFYCSILWCTWELTKFTSSISSFTSLWSSPFLFSSTHSTPWTHL